MTEENLCQLKKELEISIKELHATRDELQEKERRVSEMIERMMIVNEAFDKAGFSNKEIGNKYP